MFSDLQVCFLLLIHKDTSQEKSQWHFPCVGGSLTIRVKSPAYFSHQEHVVPPALQSHTVNGSTHERQFWLSAIEWAGKCGCSALREKCYRLTQHSSLQTNCWLYSSKEHWFSPSLTSLFLFQHRRYFKKAFRWESVRVKHKSLVRHNNIHKPEVWPIIPSHWSCEILKLCH